MKSVKQLLMYAALLLVFVIGTGILLKQYRIYKKAYQELGRMISHTSIDTEAFYAEEETKDANNTTMYFDY